MTWPRLRLCDVTDVISDGTHGSPSRDDEGVPVLSAQNVHDGRLDTNTERFTTKSELLAFERRLRVSSGDVLLTIVGTIGRAAVVYKPPHAVFQRSVAVLRPRPQVVLSTYLYRATQSADFQDQLHRYSNQSAQAGIYLKKLQLLEVPVPPIDEQRKIAAILGLADELRTKRRRTLALHDDLTQSLFLDMFGEDLLRGNRCNLKDLASVITKGTTPTSVGLNFAPAGVPFLRVQNIVGGTVRFGSDDFHIDLDAHQALRRSHVLPGDLLISIAGTIGRAAIVPSGSVEMNCNQAVAIVRVRDPRSTEWLLYWLATADARRQIKNSSVTATISNLSLGQIGALQIPLASPSSQAEFVRRVEAARAVRRTAEADQLDELFASLQARAFRGEL